MLTILLEAYQTMNNLFEDHKQKSSGLFNFSRDNDQRFLELVGGKTCKLN